MKPISKGLMICEKKSIISGAGQQLLTEIPHLVRDAAIFYAL